MNKATKAVSKSIQGQWDDMLTRGTMPIMEMELPSDEWLLVELGYDEKGIVFEFDNEHATWFDGDVKRIGDGVFMLPFDEYTSDLDHYLEAISDNMTEGYLIPNNLFV